MPNKIRLATTLCLFLTWGFFTSCGGDEKQTSKPEISMDGAADFPQNCVTVYRGETFTFRATFTDEQELGSFNLEIHNNFDHHSHSTDNTECELGAKREPVNPFVYNQDFAIPSGKTRYDAVEQIAVPADVDTGDYHFMVRLTNQAGWQEIKGISIKIADR